MKVRADVPSIGAVSSNDAGRGIGMYEKLELTFPVTTSATNLQMPYDTPAPAYAANLKPDEDARLGISVDCLLLPPGQSDWEQAKVWPGFFYRNYNRTAPGLHKVQVENLVWAGPDVWKVRFAPTIQGVWQYRIRVSDGGGTALSEPQSFVCVSSSNKGFVRVSPGDGRYLQFDSGDLAAFVGVNLFFNGLEDYRTRRARISETGAGALIRLWIAGRSGLEVIGGFANSTGGRSWNFGNETAAPCILSTEEAHSGRFSVQVPAGGRLGTGEIPVRPGHEHTLSVWVKPVGVAGDAPQVTLSSSNADTYHEGASRSWPVSSLSTETNGWAHLTLTVPGFSSADNLYAGLAVALNGADSGHLLVDDITYTDTATGMDALEIGDFERHVRYSQRQSWLLDAVVDDCAQNGQYLRVNCLENDDSVFCNVDAEAKSAIHDANNFYGHSNAAEADLPTRRWQRYYARYLLARWGYSTAIAQWEFNNEGALFNGFHYAAAQNFAKAIHGMNAERHRLCGTSFWQNSSGTSYPSDFYDSGKYPDIDYADVHFYAGPERDYGQFTPYEDADAYRGAFQRIPNGGPDSLGCLRIDAETQAGATIDILPARIKGKGKWQISYRARSTGGARISRGGHGLDIGIRSSELGGTPWLTLPGLAMPAQASARDLPWTDYASSFIVPDGALHSVSVVLAANGGFSRGRIEVSDIKVTAPDGRLWTHYTFREPLMDHDSASLSQYLGLMYTSLSGDPTIGKPFSIGETDVQNNSPDHLLTALQHDPTGTFMRRFAWAHLNPSGAIIFLWNGAGDLSIAQGWWKFVAAYQSFLKGVPLANGRYRNVEAAVSDPDLIVIGQKDSQAGQAQIFVYNRSANWFTQATDPSKITPVSGVVMIPGLPDGSYAVETWDTTTGIVKSVQTRVCRFGDLRIPIVGLTDDTAFKIAPDLVK